MSDLTERLLALADTLDGCQWHHPLMSAEACLEAVAEIARMIAELALVRAGCKCNPPLIGWHGDSPRCRICNTEVSDE